MPKRTGLRLFTKTWPPKRKDKDKDHPVDEEENEPSRPLTATLEKPTILDISFIRKIDMTLVTREFLALSNLCKIPLTIKIQPKAAAVSLVSLKGRGSRAGEDALKKGASERSPVACSAKKIKAAARLTSRSPQTSREPKFKKDPNNNSKSVKKCQKYGAQRIVEAPLWPPDDNNSNSSSSNRLSRKLLKSNKLPEPCTTCGRPDQPERFHSHPVPVGHPKSTGATASSSSRLNKMATSVKVPVKSTVQKPVAIKYKSKFTESKRVPPPMEPPAPKSGHGQVAHATPTAMMARKGSGTGKRTLTCYICCREFGTASLSLHEPKCLEKWERENSFLPQHLRRKPPIKPDASLSSEEWNEQAWQNSQATLVPCKNCSRTFYPESLRVHLRSCKSPPTMTDGFSVLLPTTRLTLTT